MCITRVLSLLLLLLPVAVQSGNFYTTSFPATENPISQQQMWTNGHTDGLDWHDIKTTGGTPGIAIGTQTESGSGFDDSVACLKGTWGNDQIVQWTIHKVSNDSASFEEYEGLLRWNIAAHNAHGYEVNCSIKGQYMQLVRWNGTLGSFTQLNNDSIQGPSTTLKDGDVIMAKIVGNTVSIFQNGTLCYSTNTTGAGGSTWTSGQPGLGLYIAGGSAGNDADFGITNYTAADGDPVVTADPQNQTVNVGQNATFTISAGGFTTLSYQWKFNGSNVGANSSSYTRSNCQLVDSGESVTCVVTDTAGNVTSGAATLTVNSTAVAVGSAVSVMGGLQNNGTITISN